MARCLPEPLLVPILVRVLEPRVACLLLDGPLGAGIRTPVLP